MKKKEHDEIKICKCRGECIFFTLSYILKILCNETHYKRLNCSKAFTAKTRLQIANVLKICIEFIFEITTIKMVSVRTDLWQHFVISAKKSFVEIKH